MKGVPRLKIEIKRNSKFDTRVNSFGSMSITKVIDALAVNFCFAISSLYFPLFNLPKISASLIAIIEKRQYVIFVADLFQIDSSGNEVTFETSHLFEFPRPFLCIDFLDAKCKTKVYVSLLFSIGENFPR